MISPLDKNYGDITGAFSSPDGERVALQVNGTAFGDARSAPYLSRSLSTRGALGWSSRYISPSIEPNETSMLGQTDYLSPDLSKSVSRSFSQLTPEAYTGPHYQGLFLHDLLTDSYENLTPGPPPDPEDEHVILGAVGSNDYGRVAFEAFSPYLAESVASPGSSTNSYEWSNGVLSKLNVLPDNSTEAAGVGLGGGGAPGDFNPSNFNMRGAVSPDGEYVFVTAFGSGQIYVREHGTTTVRASAPQGVEPSSLEPAPARYVGGAGSSVFFTSPEALTPDSTAIFNELYRFDAATGKLTDMSVDPKTEGLVGALVWGVVNYSEDGHYVYFIGLNTLVPERGSVFGYNLYVSHDGKISYITSLDGSLIQGPSRDEFDWNPAVLVNSSRISADGKHLAFESVLPLTGAETGGHREIYLYDATTEELRCVSCNPNGAASTSDAVFDSSSLSHAQLEPSVRQPRNMSADGSRVFFQTAEALVPQDTNGQVDVYEWDNGRLYLISRGSGEEESLFFDASTTGDDVVFLTRDQLVGQDQDMLSDAYDARVGGGYPPPPTAPNPCTDEACHPPRTLPPAFVAAGTVGFEGPGNVSEPAAKKPHKKRAVTKHRKRRAKKKRRGRKSVSNRIGR